MQSNDLLRIAHIYIYIYIYIYMYRCVCVYIYIYYIYIILHANTKKLLFYILDIILANSASLHEIYLI